MTGWVNLDWRVKIEVTGPKKSTIFGSLQLN